MDCQKSSITIKTVSAKDYISNLNGSEISVFNTADWLLSVGNDDCTSLFMHVFKDENIIGRAGGLVVKCKVFKDRLLYLYSYPSLDTEDYDSFLCSMRAYAKNNGIARIAIGSYDSPQIKLNAVNRFYLTKRHEFYIKLDNSEGVSYSRRFKNNLKKSKKAEIRIVQSNRKESPELLLSFIKETHNERVKKKRKDYNPLYLPFLKHQTLISLVNTDLAKYYEIYIDEKLCGVSLNLEMNSRVVVFMYGLNCNGYSQGAAAFMFDYFIEEYKKRGVKYINLGGVPDGADGDNLSIFKESMGAEKVEVYGATTNFILFPYSILNPLLLFGRLIGKNHIVRKIKEKIVFISTQKVTSISIQKYTILT
jgi:hypothetical protein